MFKIYIDGRKGSKTLDTININTEKSIDNNGDDLDKMGKKKEDINEENRNGNVDLTFVILI